MSYLELAKKIQAELSLSPANPEPSVWGDPNIVDTLVENGEIVAVLICSKVLQSHVWFAFDDSWRPARGDAAPIFFASELPHFRQMTADELRRRYDEKRCIGGWIRGRKLLS
jgi:hypothetical protein